MKKLIIGLAIGFLTAAAFAGAAGYRSYFTTADLVVTDDLTVTDDMTVGGSLINASAVPRIMSDMAVTLTSATSGSHYYSTDANGGITNLPAVAAGLNYCFTVNTAFDTANWVLTPAGSDVIDGNLIVNSASVACADETAVSFIADGEEVSDTVCLSSDGTGWYIGYSDGVTAAKITCTGG